ncbi:MAG: hypothetical protein JNM93_00140 [Bacteriovoracaceae bacterium]|nr:hypothetical protein [Bacteriovoracaceae bacterium]
MLKHKIYKFKDAWRVNYQDPIQKARVRKTFATKKAALAYIEELSQIGLVKQDVATIRILYETYERVFPDNSATNQKFFLKLFLTKFGETLPYLITTSDLENWILELKEVHELTHKSITTYKSSLNAFWEFLLKNRYITSNKWKALIIKSEANHKVLTKPQIDLIMKHLFICSEYFLYPVFRVMKVLKISLHQAINLKWENIEDNQAHIISSHGKHVKTVFLNEEAKIFLRFIKNGDGYVLTNKLGGQVRRNVVCACLRVHRMKFPVVFDFNVKLFVTSVKKCQ